jgi:hypothetical protein
VARLRPRVREQDERARQARIRQVGQQLARIALAQADVGQALFVDVAQGAGDAVDERLGAQDQHARMTRGLGGHVLAAAESYLQPDLDGVRRQRAWLDHAVRNGDARQQALQQRRLARLDRPRLDAAVAAEGRVRLARQARPRRSLARSVFSHEKPPSASGARPKWP